MSELDEGDVKRKFPFYVVDAWQTTDDPGPTGCWTWAAADALARRLSAAWGPGRYKVETNPKRSVSR